MNHVEAYTLLTSALAAYRSLSFRQLAALVNERSSQSIRGNNGVEYAISVSVRWRDAENGDIRVIGMIGEANWGGPHDSLDETFVVPWPPAEDVVARSSTANLI